MQNWCIDVYVFLCAHTWCLVCSFCRSVCFFPVVSFAWFCLGLIGLETFSLCAPIIVVTIRTLPTKHNFWSFFLTITCVPTMHNDHQRACLPLFHSQFPKHVPLYTSEPINTPHILVTTSPTRVPTHVMFFTILSCFAMWCILCLRACLVHLRVCFGVFPLSACPNPNPEHICPCHDPFPDFL